VSQGHTPDIAFWSGPGGQQWARYNDFTERLLAPVTAALLAATAAKPGERVVDIGCGCGMLALALAKHVGPKGFVRGIDVSAAMLAVGRRATPPDAAVEFVEADATTYKFAARDFDLLVSRHGVMFFADPVHAFTNLRAALKPGGRLVFSCFREPRLNPWAMAPLQAAYQFVPPLPRPGPEDPSPFAFADEGRVRRILDGAGFADIMLTPHDLMFDIGAGRGLDGAVANMVEIGPGSRALDGQSDETRAKAIDGIRAALAPFVTDNAVKLGAAIWLVTARNP